MQSVVCGVCGGGLSVVSDAGSGCGSALGVKGAGRGASRTIGTLRSRFPAGDWDSFDCGGTACDCG